MLWYNYLCYITCRWRTGGLIMSNKKAKLVKGTYITEAMFDLMTPLYTFCISNSKSKSRVDIKNYEPSKLSFKDLDRVPNIGDIVSITKTDSMGYRFSEVVKIRQIKFLAGTDQVMVTSSKLGGANWFNLNDVYPIKLNHQVLMDLGFETYGKDCVGNYRYRFILKGFLNLKLTMDSYDGNLDFMVWASEGEPLIHYLHELQDILRISGRNRVINNSKYSHEVMVLTKLEYPIYLLPSNNDRSACWYTNK